MKICFDIDGVLATITKDLDYMKAQPIPINIVLANRLYQLGHTIILHTARGSETGIDWYEQTLSQMKRFGLNFHKLIMGKPAADKYVDDRMATIKELRKLAI